MELITFGEAIIAAVNFIITPAWHLVVLYAIIFAIIAWKMVKEWGF